MMQRATNLVFLILVMVILLGGVSLVYLASSQHVPGDGGREAITCSEEPD